ncbi:TetR/AcrR family transcriptional regulator [Desulfitobacterium metallireducens]|uniref:TetR family transcriptional regulator n=1 Tax=Desulfitobacterium metallireducens DSM 15288 TaxID=871968 RepID=W0EB72_9FIRM|nr:TetR/AcrR family transcriptional regulator [Desulfitobacterium metallireducens]AHF08115.1 TetR family transcriptional regulator [Desulfitobacterium metallireducens DSM 15288]
MTAKEEKRVEILNAAIKVFSEAGIEGATIEGIAKEAGIGKGTVYDYFDSKNTLFQEMIRYSGQRFRDDLVSVIEQGDTMMEKIRLISQFYAKFLKEHLDIFGSIMTGQTLSEDMRSRMLKEMSTTFKAVEDMIQVGIQTLELKADIDIEIAASCILGGVQSYAMKKLFVDGYNPDEIDHEGIAKVILTGLIE